MDSLKFAKIQRALGEPKRLEILEHIREMAEDKGIMCSVILARSGVSQSTFSHHISELAESGLIEGKKDGRMMLLSVNETLVKEYLEALKIKILGKK